MSRVLVVDDEPKLGRVMQEMLELDGHAVERAGGGADALARLAAAPFDVVVTDLRMPGVDGLAVLRGARARPAPPAVVLVTAYGTAESAVEAMKAGAADYVTKPFSMDELRLRVARLAAQRRAEANRAGLVARLTPDLVAESPAMAASLAAARQVAASDATVLLLGESGTGKSQLARFVHFQSRRAAGPLVEVNCAALPEALLESELFGHEKGAFTGAAQRRVGHLAAADGGTLFLDEIGEITAATQAKLLRFLEDRTFVALGATSEQRVDVRVVAATNGNLAAEVRAGRFREDLWYRLDVLRDRGAAAPRAPGGRAPARPPLPRRARAAGGRALPGRARAARRASLARQRPRARERPRARAHPRGRGWRTRRSTSSRRARRRRAPAARRSSSATASRSTTSSGSSSRPRWRAPAATRPAAARLLGVTRRRLYSLLASHGLDGGEAR